MPRKVCGPRVARGRPNWWVILAVSLGLMALLVATAGQRPAGAQAEGRARPQPAAHISPGPGCSGARGAGTPSTTTTTTVATTTTTAPAPPPAAATATHAASTRRQRPATCRATVGAGSTPAPAPSVTTTTLAPPTTTTTTAAGRGRARRPHADPGLPQSPAPAVQQVRVHRDGRDGDLRGLVREHLPHHGGQLPERRRRAWAGRPPWPRPCPTPAGVAWPRSASRRRSRPR